MEQLLRQRAESIWTAAIRSVLPDEAVRRALEHFHPQGLIRSNAKNLTKP